jgi:hypothetical protein
MKMQDRRRRAVVSMALALPLAPWADDRPVEWGVHDIGGGGRDIGARTVIEPMSAPVERERDLWGPLIEANPIRLD